MILLLIPLEWKKHPKRHFLIIITIKENFHGMQLSADVGCPQSAADVGVTVPPIPCNTGECGSGNPFSVGFLWWRQGTSAGLGRLILLAGDVETNPGPPVTHAAIARNVSCRDWAIFCVDCKKWVHRQCANMTIKSIKEHAN